MWDDCPNCGYAPGQRDNGLCDFCAAEEEAELRQHALLLWNQEQAEVGEGGQ
jgi:hypothetical protein